jgi:DNA invertase Pin-like site-specific DNA recombinase
VEPSVRAVFYRRASTREQGDSGLGLDAQLRKLRAEAAHRGWTVVDDFHDVASGKRTNGRDGLKQALAMLKRHDADVLVVSKLDRLSRSVADFARLMQQARRERWAVVALDLNIDTTSATGELMANMLAALAQWERRLISERTKDALAEKKEQGVQLGKPSPLPTETRRTIRRLRTRGLGARRIAAWLNEHDVPTASGEGKQWHVTQVQRVLTREEKKRA